MAQEQAEKVDINKAEKRVRSRIEGLKKGGNNKYTMVVAAHWFLERRTLPPPLPCFMPMFYTRSCGGWRKRIYTLHPSSIFLQREMSKDCPSTTILSWIFAVSHILPMVPSQPALSSLLSLDLRLRQLISSGWLFGPRSWRLVKKDHPRFDGSLTRRPRDSALCPAARSDPLQGKWFRFRSPSC